MRTLRTTLTTFLVVLLAGWLGAVHADAIGDEFKLREAARKGNGDAAYLLGLAYERGGARNASREDAYFWYQFGAKLGHRPSEVGRARLDLLAEGHELVDQRTQAHAVLKSLAEAGVPEAYEALAIYYRAVGVSDERGRLLAVRHSMNPPNSDVAWANEPISEALAEVLDRLGALEGRVGELGHEVASTRESVEGVSARFALFDSRFGVLEQQIAGLASPGSVSEGGREMEGLLAEYDERLIWLESDLAAQIDALRKQSGAMLQRLAATNNRITGLDDSVNALLLASQKGEERAEELATRETAESEQWGRRTNEAGTRALREGDYANAIHFFLRSAQVGNIEAQNNLGYMYAKGLGTRKDEALAVEYYRMAAEAGNPTAQYNLGRALQAGSGVAADAEAARDWLTRSAEQGYGRAVEALKANGWRSQARLASTK